MLKMADGAYPKMEPQNRLLQLLSLMDKSGTNAHVEGLSPTRFVALCDAILYYAILTTMTTITTANNDSHHHQHNNHLNPILTSPLLTLPLLLFHPPLPIISTSAPVTFTVAAEAFVIEDNKSQAMTKLPPPVAASRAVASAPPKSTASPMPPQVFILSLSSSLPLC